MIIYKSKTYFSYWRDESNTKNLMARVPPKLKHENKRFNVPCVTLKV